MLRRGLSRAQIQRWASQATLECSPATMYLLEDAPPTKATITAEEAVKYYTEMQTIRRMELKADQLYKQKGTGSDHATNGPDGPRVEYPGQIILWAIKFREIS